MGCTQIVSFVRSGNDVEKHQQPFNVNFDFRESSSASTDGKELFHVSMFAGVAVHVVDSYIAGEVASSKIRISGVPMAYYGR